jgi:uncharacterized protein YpmS
MPINSPTWIDVHCDENQLVTKLNDLADKGYMPWRVDTFDIQDAQSANVVTKKTCRILAYRANNAYAR